MARHHGDSSRAIVRYATEDPYEPGRWYCFLRTQMDVLVMGNYVVEK